MTRPSKNKILVVTNLIGDKPLNSTGRADNQAITWDETEDEYVHSNVLTTASVTYETLNSNGDVGTAAGQLAIGNHTHATDELTVSTDKNFVTDAQLALVNSISASTGVYSIQLSSGADVATRIVGATVPSGWTLEVGTTNYDIQINHNKNTRVAFVSVFYIDGTEEIMLFNTAAFNGIRTPDTNTLMINSIATGVISKEVKIYITFV